ncbi:glycerate kinase [Erysipelothrix sp. HDW6C]|uniref:glycerate kinase family protein n=1 Tax=Erysipelothrix sp. HDW6C TaxID=2714930 RepID=UPI00140A5D17|nr:glycerate kinase [Erysipelothrix sp. HDW6C]QIK70307.1 glycerate kinase [Erysipelothrix sp. HDW6C]
MKIVFAPDSFKESMTAKEVCIAMETGFKKILPDAEFVHVPMADGGEGTVQSLVDATQGKQIHKSVKGPLGNPVDAVYGILGDGETAIIEMASASGIAYVSEATKNPLITTTYGTGELILDALDQGVHKIILGIGGSATNDGGTGMARALGVRFLDKDGNDLPEGGGALDALATIDTTNTDVRIKTMSIIVASDVTNPLCGKNGASQVFGPQKGATPEMVQHLDRSLSHYADIASHDLGKDVKDVPGAGGAGGLGAGLLLFTNSKMQRGIDIVIEYSRLGEALKDADYCITGEGGIDFQTKFGKTPYGVAKEAKKQSIPVIVVAGNVGDDIDSLYDHAIDSIFGIVPGAMSLGEALKEGPQNVQRTCENIARLLNTVNR